MVSHLVVDLRNRRLLHQLNLERLTMSNTIIVGCDLHDRKMALQIACGKELLQSKFVANNCMDRGRMVGLLKRLAKENQADRIVFAYEASGSGFGLLDELIEAGIECYVLAPSALPHSSKSRKRKTDMRDAQIILEVLKGHVLAGNELPTVWVPGLELRDDRVLVRSRLDLADRIGKAKTQIRSLLRLCGMSRPADAGGGWTRALWWWLNQLAYCDESPLSPGTRRGLLTLLRELGALERERDRLDRSIEALAQMDRYVEFVAELTKLKGIGTLTALVFLTELGDLTRFSNRRQVGSYLGLTPSSFESGNANDRKGHTTRQGPSRVRRVLCQAVWSQVRWDESERAAYQRICARNPKKKKIAIVACMRRLGIKLWHRGMSVLERRKAADTSEAQAA